ncbi:MAG: oligoendopeptidase F [Metamycoplasmataceae bacterium]
MKLYKKYDDIPEKYRFDLDYLLEGKKIEDLITKYFKLSEFKITEKDSKYESPEAYLRHIKKQEEVSILGNKIFNYISNNISVNIVSPEFNKLQEDLEFKLFEFNKRLGSETNRFFANEKKMREWVKLPSFKNYKKDIIFVLDGKKHKLPNEIEEFIKKISRAEISSSDVFSILYNSELNYKYAISKSGKKTKISLANRTALLKSNDESIRKSTFNNWNDAYLQHKGTFANLLYQHFKNISVWSLERKYDSSVSALIDEDQVDKKLLETLYNSVQKNNYHFQRFYKLKKDFFSIKFKKPMKAWDTTLPLVNVEVEYTISEMQKEVRSALKPLGKEYDEKVKEMFQNRWIDYVHVENKRSGAYSIGGSYGLDKKYILMNFDGSIRSVSTLAHEIGHSMHSYFSDKEQPINLASYPIFLAEIASIFNELMLQDYLINNTKDEKLKFHLLSEAIEDFEGTVRRQTMWSNYEYDLYNLIDEGKSISTFDAIKEIYAKNAKKYELKKNQKFNKDSQLIASVIVPHFYYDFYVYKYAIGFIVANTFFQRYKSGGKQHLENYINKFLKAGGSDWPVEILKDAGIDLYNKDIYDQAFNILKTKIDDYEKIGKKLFKNPKNR